MIIYHGSTEPITEPRILRNQRALDFGNGFYTTTNIEQAEQWARKVAERKNENRRIISIYEFDENIAERELTVLKFSEPGREWLKFVCDCRNDRIVKCSYDMVFGPVADDRVYEAIKLYEAGTLNEEETLKRLKIQKLFNQILFHTEHSLNFCRYMKSIEIQEVER